jgi:amino acid transporter
MGLLFSYLGYLFSKDKYSSPLILIYSQLSYKWTFLANWFIWLIGSIGNIVSLNVFYKTWFSMGGIYEIFIKIFIILFFVGINCYRSRWIFYGEIFVNIIKTILLIFIPMKIFYIKIFQLPELSAIDWSYFLMFKKISFNILSISIWYFYGVEACAIIGKKYEKITNKDIRINSLISSFFIIFLYLLNILAVLFYFNFQLVPFNFLEKIFSLKALYLVKICISFICLMSINSWIIFSGNVGYDAAELSLFPVVFLKKNKNGQPVFSLFFSNLLIVIVIILGTKKEFLSFILNVFNYLSNGIFYFYILYLYAFWKEYKYKSSLILCVLMILFVIFNMYYNITIFFVTLCTIILSLPLYTFFRKLNY